MPPRKQLTQRHLSGFLLTSSLFPTSPWAPEITSTPRCRICPSVKLPPLTSPAFGRRLLITPSLPGRERSALTVCRLTSKPSWIPTSTRLSHGVIFHRRPEPLPFT